MSDHPAATLRTARLDLVGLDVERDLDALHEMFGDPYRPVRDRRRQRGPRGHPRAAAP